MVCMCGFTTPSTNVAAMPASMALPQRAKMRAPAEPTSNVRSRALSAGPSKAGAKLSRYYHPIRAIQRFLWSISALDDIIFAVSLSKMVAFGTRFRNDEAIRWEGGGGWECCATLLPGNLAKLYNFPASASNPAHSMACLGVAQLLLHERSRVIQRFDIRLLLIDGVGITEIDQEQARNQ
jgi:hypothetical protein